MKPEINWVKPHQDFIEKTQRDLQKLEAKAAWADRAKDALIRLATPIDITHLVHPKCLCSNCYAKEILSEWPE